MRSLARCDAFATALVDSHNALWGCSLSFGIIQLADWFSEGQFMRNWTIAAFVAVSAVAFTQTALAADMPIKAARAPVVAPAYNWTGFYVGLNAGAAFGHADPHTSTIFDPAGYFATTSIPAINAIGNASVDGAGFTGGIQFGYNWQFNNNAVLGLETDFGYLGLNKSVSGTALYPCCAPTGFTINQSVKSTWLWTVRPRLGWAANNWLLYITGGLAVAEIKGDFLFTDTFAAANESASLSKTKAGWALGGGVEYALAGPWSVKAEYLHVDFSTVSTTSTNLRAGTPTAVPFPANVYTHSIKLSDDLVRVGVNYRFH
jgi:outer membrane immunogenic protein